MKQHTAPCSQPDSLATSSMLTVSDDGYIRLSFAELQAVCLTHLISGLDEEPPETITDGATPTEIVGYTEWLSNTMPSITIGWDWQLDVTHNDTALRKISEPRSNIMVRDSTGMDIGPARTAVLLDALIDVLDWTTVVRNHINVRYGK